MTHPKKRVLNSDDTIFISCSISGWFNPKLTKNNNLIMYINEKILSFNFSSNNLSSSGLTELSLEVYLEEKYLGDNRVVCVWTFEDVVKSTHVHKVEKDINIWSMEFLNKFSIIIIIINVITS